MPGHDATMQAIVTMARADGFAAYLDDRGMGPFVLIVNPEDHAPYIDGAIWAGWGLADSVNFEASTGIMGIGADEEFKPGNAYQTYVSPYAEDDAPNPAVMYAWLRAIAAGWYDAIGAMPGNLAPGAPWFDADFCPSCGASSGDGATDGCDARGYAGCGRYYMRRAAALAGHAYRGMALGALNP